MKMVDLFDKARNLPPLFPVGIGSRETVIEHRLSTGQIFRFNIKDVEYDPVAGVIVLVTDGCELDRRTP